VPQQPAAPRRSIVDALVAGDWSGAARAGGLAIAAMLAVSLVGVLLATGGGVGLHETIALVFAAVSLAVGGNAFTEAGAESFASSASLGLLPLTVTFTGLGVLARQSVLQWRRTGATTASDTLLHGVRTVLVFTACFLPLALLTRYEVDGGSDDLSALVGQVGLGVGVVSTVTGAVLFGVATLGLTWLFSQSTGRLAAIRDASRAPLVGALAVFAVGILAVVAALGYGLVEVDEPMVQIGATVLAAANGVLASVLLAAGVPLNAEGTATMGPLGRFSTNGPQTFDLFTFTDASAWSWLAPVALLATMVLVAAALAVRQNTVEDARREGVRFAGALAAVAFVAALLLRIAGEAALTESSSVSGEASATFNPLMAAFVLGLWGVATGLLAPVVAAKLPTGFVLGVRHRFGAAAQPVQPVQSPIP
jgi:hypothetical protein